jgi:hypothetical protein
VFISSTGEDLKDYREAAIDVCNRRQLIPIAMEQFPAMGARANEGSKRKLDESDVYVGIFAHRYGYVETGSPVSVTEVEFDHAGEHGLERLCFLLDPTFPWPQAYIDFAGHDKLEAFKRKVNTLVRAVFTSVDNFRDKLNDCTDRMEPEARATARCYPRYIRTPLRAILSLRWTRRGFGSRPAIYRRPLGRLLSVNRPCGLRKDGTDGAAGRRQS